MKLLKTTILFALMIAVSSLFLGCSLDSNGIASAEEYKNDAVFIDNVNIFSQNPEKYKGEKVQLVLNIYDVKINGNDANIYASIDGLDRQNQVFLLHYKMKDKDENFKAGDLIRVWCEYKGMTESKELNALGQSEKVIECDAAYIEKPIWGGLYDASENPKRALSGKAANGQDVKFKFSKLVVCADSLDVEAGTV